MESSDIWKQILAYIEGQISRPSFETWFQNSRGYIKDERELIIEAENEFARDWLESRYMSLIDEAIDEVKSDIDSYVIVTRERMDEPMRKRRRFQENEITEMFQLLNEILRETQEVKEQNEKIMRMLEELSFPDK
ncbi:DnaA N-terminal domain-containing protein [Tepidibacillus fermentans]|uniref:DnaA-like protein n=1 Tax=Tepidibacillus fermentans TaxID=1281767 RepID=A0A4R3KNA6_9BACI|nr:DnaA N-terminal domain-containing protein [Tepidibacillus fermentans]TCS84508.1 DnaA-like protein [Tepidibacillus fermentans]